MCAPVKPSTKLTKGRPRALVRPLTNLIRESKPVTILLHAIRGKPLQCTKSNEKDFASAIRMDCDQSIPTSFYSSVSACGLSRGDVSNDAGDNSTLAHIRKLVNSVFDRSTFLLRLLSPLFYHVSNPEVRQNPHDTIEMLSGAANRNPYSTEICWNDVLSNCTI